MVYNLAMIFLLIVLYVLIILMMFVKPVHSPLSEFELERRIKQNDDQDAFEALRREKLIPNVIIIKYFFLIVFGLVFVGSAITLCGTVWGLLMSGLAAVVLGPIMKLRTISKASNSLYSKAEDQILDFSDRFSSVFDFFRDISNDITGAPRVDSKEELEHVITSSDPSIITDDEKAIILATIKFSEKSVSDIMVPKSQVTYLSKDEQLTPLVLDKLHKTSYSHFPVVADDIDHVEGVLRAKDVLSISDKRSPKAGNVMEKRVFFVRNDHSLEYALNAFVRTGYYFFVVINEHRETVGILTLRDLMESLVGREVNDEFDGDDDRKAVADRKPLNNSSKTVIDV